MSITEVTAGEAQLCVVCKEAIADGAKKCIHCSSFQGRAARHLTVSPVVLSLLVAMVSVITAAVPVMQPLFVHDRTEIVAAYQGSTITALSLLFTNVGDRPGSVKEATLRLVEPGKAIDTPLRFMLPQSNPMDWGDSEPLLIPGGQSRQVYAAIGPLPDGFIPGQNGHCTLTYVFYTYEGVASVQQQDLVCAEISMALGRAIYQGSARARRK